MPAVEAGTRAPIRPVLPWTSPAEGPLLPARAKGPCRPWLRACMSTHRQGHPRTPGTSSAPGLPAQAWRPPWATSLSASRTVAGRSATTSPCARTLGPGLAGNLVPARPVARTLPAGQRPAPGAACVLSS